MKLRVSHRTRYRYSEPVHLDPHTLRLMPRGAGTQRVSNHRLEISPRPSVFGETLDAHGNAVHGAWFEGVTEYLEIDNSFEVETLRSNPFDFVLSDLSLATLPIVYPAAEQPVLAPYCRGAREGLVYSFARAAAQETEWQTIPFLSALNRRLYQNIEHVTREEGDAQPAEVTLSQRRGACRDTAVAFVACCRAMGLAARFVSGYELEAARGDQAYMHAWGEVYLPGGGWRGYDPSRGLAVAEHHVAVAAADTPAMATPVSGSFRSSTATAEMSFVIRIEEI